MSGTNTLAEELEAFEASKAALVSDYPLGYYAVFIGRKFMGAFAKYHDALVKGYSEVGNKAFLVKPIALEERVAHIAGLALAQ